MTPKRASEILTKKGLEISASTIQRRAMRCSDNPEGLYGHVTPCSSSLTSKMINDRIAYATHGPIIKPVSLLTGKLSGRWKDRKRRIAWVDWKPFYNGQFHHRNTHRQYRRKNSDKELTKNNKEKFQKKFMVLSAMSWNGLYGFIHATKVRNKRRSRNENNELVRRYLLFVDAFKVFLFFFFFK